MRTSILTLALLPFLSGCVTFNWNRISRHAPVGAELLATLEPGASDLHACLEAMGAPLLVLEADDGHGAILVYVWHTELNRGLRVSVPVSDYAQADFDYDVFSTKARGAMLFFDEAWALEEVREGQLLDLSDDLRRRRPALVE